MQVRYAHPARISGNLGVVPFNREGDRSVAEHTEIVALVRVLRDPLAGKHQIPSESLLEPGMEFIAEARAQGIGNRCRTREQRIQDRIAASDTGKYQVLIERRFQGARVGNAKNRARLLDVV